jgi:pilus assembly protein CpaE
MRTLVISDNPVGLVSVRLRGVLRTLVDQQNPVTAGFAEVEARVPQVQPEMLLVVLSPDPERGLEVVRKARRLMSGYVLAVGATAEPKLILRALQEGADHYLDEADLEAGLQAVLARLESKQEAGTPSRRLIALLPASGGCGASTLAVNIAASLAKLHNSCALLDLKPGRGDLAALLDVHASFNLADICLNVARLDRAMFEKALVRHASGIHLLAAPQVFGATRVVTTQGVNQAVAMARRLFPHVVADVEDCFHEEQVGALRLASTVLVVSRLDFTSLRNMRRVLDHLSEADIPRQLVRVVINRYGQPNELPVAEAESALGDKIAYFIPDDARTINGANNTGVPAVIKAPSAKVSQAIVQLAKGSLDRRRSGEPTATAAGRMAWR